MHLIPFCKIEIAGKYRLSGANEVEIKKSIHQTIQQAKIKLPLNVVLRTPDRLNRIKLIDVIKEGDAVKIFLGVNGKERLEFEGFIRRINYGTPVEVECEDQLYLLRKVNFFKSFRQIKLTDLLTYVVDKMSTEKGFSPVLYDKIPELTFKNFIMRSDTTGVQVLQELRDKYGMYPYLTEIAGVKTLYCSLAYSLNKGKVKHVLDKNTLPGNSLVYNIGEDKTYKVKVTVFQKNGLQQDYEFGDRDGELRTVFLYGDFDHAYIKHYADAEMLKFRSQGYKGFVETFLIPYCEPGMTSSIVNEQFTDRSGNYYIGAVTSTLNTSGGRRKVELEVKV